MADIVMTVDGEEYIFGRYPYSTNEEKNRVNELAIKVASERGIYVYVREI